MQPETAVKKINHHEVKFIVSPENRVVVAEIQRCCNDLLGWFETESGLEYPIFAKQGASSAPSSAFLPPIMRSIARCHPDDEFNADVGMDVAYKKLQKKYWEKYAIRAMRLLKHLEAVHDSLSMELKRAALKAESIDPTAHVG